jgi:tyrosyl-tRNA synthetase
MKLAREIITTYHSEKAALEAEERFKLVFSRKDIPDDIREVIVNESEIWLPRFMMDNGMVESTSDARRMLKQGAVKLNGHKVETETIAPADGMVIQVGKRKFIKIKI